MKVMKVKVMKSATKSNPRSKRIMRSETLESDESVSRAKFLSHEDALKSFGVTETAASTGTGDDGVMLAKVKGAVKAASMKSTPGTNEETKAHVAATAGRAYRSRVCPQVDDQAIIDDELIDHDIDEESDVPAWLKRVMGRSDVPVWGGGSGGPNWQMAKNGSWFKKRGPVGKSDYLTYVMSVNALGYLTKSSSGHNRRDRHLKFKYVRRRHDSS